MILEPASDLDRPWCLTWYTLFFYVEQLRCHVLSVARFHTKIRPGKCLTPAVTLYVGFQSWGYGNLQEPYVSLNR